MIPSPPDEGPRDVSYDDVRLSPDERAIRRVEFIARSYSRDTKNKLALERTARLARRALRGQFDRTPTAVPTESSGDPDAAPPADWITENAAGSLRHALNMATGNGLPLAPIVMEAMRAARRTAGTGEGT